MKNLIRGSVVALVGAMALLAAYASLSGPPAAGGARPVSARAVAAPVSEPKPHSTADSAAPSANSALAAKSGAPETGGLPAAAADCDFCLYAADPQTTAPSVAGQDDLWLPSDERSAPEVAGFGEWPAQPTLAGFEPDTAVAAPAPEISTAAMLTLGLIVLTARARRKAWAAWKTAWMSAAPA